MTLNPPSAKVEDLSKQEILQQAHAELQRFDLARAEDPEDLQPHYGGFKASTTLLTLVIFVLVCLLIIALASHSKKDSHANHTSTPTPASTAPR